jgi:DNA-binding MarR family transcriptional regulator
MDNKELLLKAIDNYDVYSLTQRETLKALVNISIDSVATVSPTGLSKLIKIKRGIIYHNLKIFEKDKFIEKITKTTKRASIFRLSEPKLDYLVKLYENKRNYFDDTSK